MRRRVSLKLHRFDVQQIERGQGVDSYAEEQVGLRD
jgi:hypothetical protein